MKITLRTQHYSEDQRRALWWHKRGDKHAGNPRNCPMATREDCRIHLEDHGRSLDDDMNFEWSRAIDLFESNNQTEATASV